MATFDCIVDTTPMANSVDTVSKHVLGTTAAVTAMQAAVIKTEMDSADTICKNVDRGFYSLIRSQLSMKLAKHYTEMNAKLVLLLEYSKSLGKIQNRMEADVNRLRREYYKTFHGLDKALENRVYQLDKNAMILADLRNKLLRQHVVKDIAKVVCTDLEATRVSQLSLTAHMKTKTSATLNAIEKNVCANQKFRVQIKEILGSKKLKDSAQEYVPVIYRKAQSTAVAGTEVVNLYFPDFMEKNMKDQIETSMMNQIEQLVEGEVSAEDKAEIAKEFQKLMSESSVTQRVAQTMMKLFGNEVRP